MSVELSLPARLKEPVRIAYVALVPDGVGGHSESWETLASCFAEVVPLRNLREQVVAAQREGRSGYRITIRAREDVTTAMRVEWRGVMLAIEGVTSTRSVTEIIAYAGGVA